MEQKKICCSPKVWTRIVGWLGIVLAICHAIQIPLAIDQLSSMLKDIGKDQEAAFFKSNSMGMRATVFISSMLSVLVDAMLLVGNEQGRPGLLLPWLIWNWISFVGISFLMCLFMGLLVGLLIPLLAAPVLPAIFLYTVHRRYAEIQEIKDKKRRISILSYMYKM